MYTVIGSCSLCGGEVRQHTGPWMGVIPPVPTCSSCGATLKLPVVPMQPARREFPDFSDRTTSTARSALRLEDVIAVSERKRREELEGLGMLIHALKER